MYDILWKMGNLIAFKVPTKIFIVHSGPNKGIGNVRCEGTVGSLCKEHAICARCQHIWPIPYKNLMMLAKMRDFRE